MSWTRIPSRIASRRIVNASVKVNMLPIYYCPESHQDRRRMPASW